MRCFSVRGFTAATAGLAANDVVAQLWNPSADDRLWVVEIGMWRGGTVGPRCTLQRTSAQGTAGSTVTPDADNAWDGETTAPATGAVLNLAAFSVQPTLVTPSLEGSVFVGGTGTTGFGTTWNMEPGVCVPPGSGLAIVATNTAAYSTSEIYVVWVEGEN